MVSVFSKFATRCTPFSLDFALCLALFTIHPYILTTTSSITDLVAASSAAQTALMMTSASSSSASAQTRPMDEMNLDPLSLYTVAGISLKTVYENLLRGKIPRLFKDFAGTVRLEFVEAIDDPTPRIYIMFSFKVCSYLGNYGAGKVLRTFSLLPGEKTKITMRSYRSESGYAKQSRNVLDSLSEDSALEMEQMIENESRETSSYSENKFSEKIKTFDLDVSYKVSASIPIKVAKLDVST